MSGISHQEVMQGQKRLAKLGVTSLSVAFIDDPSKINGGVIRLKTSNGADFRYPIKNINYAEDRVADAIQAFEVALVQEWMIV